MALIPTLTDCDLGCVVMIGAIREGSTAFTVSVAAELVTDPAAFVTTTV